MKLTPVGAFLVFILFVVIIIVGVHYAGINDGPPECGGSYATFGSHATDNGHNCEPQ